VNSIRAQRRDISSEAVLSSVLCYKLKSILEVGSKVRSSIEDPFRQVNLVGKRSCWVTRQRSRYDHCIGTCECYYLVSSFVF